MSITPQAEGSAPERRGACSCSPGAAPVGLSFRLTRIVPPLSTLRLIADHAATYTLCGTCSMVGASGTTAGPRPRSLSTELTQWDPNSVLDLGLTSRGDRRNGDRDPAPGSCTTVKGRDTVSGRAQPPFRPAGPKRLTIGPQPPIHQRMLHLGKLCRASSVTTSGVEGRPIAHGEIGKWPRWKTTGYQ